MMAVWHEKIGECINHLKIWTFLRHFFSPKVCLIGIMVLFLPLPACKTSYYQFSNADFIRESKELAASFRERALKLESQQEIGKALLDWQIVLGLDPGNTLARSKVEALSRQVREKADAAYRKGVAAVRRGALAAANQSFVRALSYDAEHEKALPALQALWRKQDFVAYEQTQADTSAGIAEKLYADPDKAELVAYFLNTEQKTPGAQGKKSIVFFPRLSAVTARGQPPGISKKAVKAPTTKKVGSDQQGSEKKTQPLSPDAKMQTYTKGKRLFSQNRLQQALSVFNGLDPEFLDTQYWIDTLEQKIQEKARDLYKKGLIHFLAEDLDEAILAWEETLKLSPQHDAARNGLEKARRLKKNLENYP